MSTTEIAAAPASPGELTTEFLTHVLRSHQQAYSPAEKTVLEVKEFTWKPLDVGVISEVVGIQALVAVGSATEDKQYVAKFLRPEFPFEKMFVVESNFYTHFCGQTASLMPFQLPTCVYTSKSLIILERVGAIKTIKCVDGCPEEKIEDIVAKMAQMHARFRDSQLSSLASPAGIGAELSGEAKREQFPSAWQPFLDDVVLESSDKVRLAAICERLSAKPQTLEGLHEKVATGPKAFIHGDFHVANMLFPTQQSEKNDSSSFWLLDWATCGEGNAMRDLAFFFIVSVHSTHRRKLEAACLKIYSDTAAKEGWNNYSLAQWQQFYRMCVWNQLAILIVYDSLTKHLVANAKSDKLKTELDHHFREVNYRACLAALDNFRDEDFAALSSL
ncbi:TPA: hypothetical protein N0F65_011678 [Lagenidium giganteum]|uniref:CHK kinase-like domain-containing protein n=1 Tax=Lagenidium giganteum TaxID=4803 RepID=A0AAV2ZD10_9STRA|nr:TPA: hypothetical protein N0F65_011678 [Lagenidium giganteum]